MFAEAVPSAEGGRMSRRLLGLFTATIATCVVLLASDASAFGIDWTCVGNCGTLGADGDVTAPPSGTTYDYVSTYGAPSNSGLDLGFNETNGSTLASPTFSASGSDQLAFYFNFVTSDGAGFPEYAWAELLPAGGGDNILLFTARTCEVADCDTVPGVAMPPLGAGVTLVPASTPITANATHWSALGPDSGGCWAVGCGNSGWIQMLYTPAAGDYMLRFGTVNVNDTAFDSGMAVAGATIAGKPIDDGDGEAPEPATMMLFGAGLLGTAARARARRRQV
jgi:hypothetical protein